MDDRPNETRPLNAQMWKRDDLDWYVEERRASAALFRAERFVGAVWDPACGQGNILEEAILAGYTVSGSDVRKRIDRYWFVERDFLTSDKAALGQNIVVNPPFFRGKGTEAFARRALEIATGKVAIFADLAFLAGDKRARGLWADHPPHRVWVVHPRVSCPPGEWLQNGNKAGNGTADWCWLVFDQTAPRASAPALHWLNAARGDVPSNVPL